MSLADEIQQVIRAETKAAKKWLRKESIRSAVEMAAHFNLEIVTKLPNTEYSLWVMKRGAEYLGLATHDWQSQGEFVTAKSLDEVISAARKQYTRGWK